MLTYAERLELAAQRYKEIQAAHVRRAWGPLAEGRTSIPSTAEVLAILRCAGEPLRSRSVQDGLKYLATRVFIHSRPLGVEGGRGPLTRWLVYALVGLTQWRGWERDETPRLSSRIKEPATVAGAVTYCVEKLRDIRVNDGWPDRADQRQCSVLQTATAIMALSRAKQLPKEVAAARDLLALRQSRRDGSWPAMVTRRSYRGDGSPAHTALAVLALADGSEIHREHAEKGRNWLLRNADKWQRATHPERPASDEAWEHMTFALGLRACLRTGIDPLTRELAPSIELLDELWVGSGSERHQWQAGAEEVAGAHGSHGVVLAYEELHRSQRRVDPIVFFDLVKTAKAADTEIREHYQLQFDSNGGFITIMDSRTSQQLAPIPLSGKRWMFVRRIAELQYENGNRRDSVPLEEMLVVTENSRAMIRQINKVVKTVTGGKLEKLLVVPKGSSACILTVRPADASPD